MGLEPAPKPPLALLPPPLPQSHLVTRTDPVSSSEAPARRSRIAHRIPPIPKGPNGITPRQMVDLLGLKTGHRDARSAIGKFSRTQLEEMGFTVDVCARFRDFFAALARESAAVGHPNPSAEGRRDLFDWMTLTLSGESQLAWTDVQAA